MSRTRTRRIAKWTGLVVCAGLTVMMFVSQWWAVRRLTEELEIAIVGRGIWLQWVTVEDWPAGSIISPNEDRGWSILNNDGLQFRPTGIVFNRRSPLCWWFHYQSFGTAGIQLHTVQIPLWMPLLAIAIPTAWLWRRDRRYPPAHCRKCGYDLTGNVTGVCSECGVKVKGP